MVFYMLKKEEKISYISKHSSNCEKRIILLMISNGERWHRNKKLSALRGITRWWFFHVHKLSSFI